MMKGLLKEGSNKAVAQNEAKSRTYSVQAACAMVYYAAERTLMSVMLMVLGLMGLGFVIDRFGLVLLKASRVTSVHSHSISHWTGTILVITGSFVLIIAIVRYASLERRFHREGCGITGHGLTLGVFFALFIALIGVMIGVLLMTVRQ